MPELLYTITTSPEPGQSSTFTLNQQQLTSLSPFFECITRHPCQESLTHNIKLNCSPSIFQKILSIAFHQQFPSSPKDLSNFSYLEQLLETASLYQIDVVSDLCEKKLLEIARLNDYKILIELLSLAKFYNLKALQNYTLIILASNFLQIKDKLALLPHNIELLIDLLERDDLDTDQCENHVLEFVGAFMEKQLMLKNQEKMEIGNRKIEPSAILSLVNCVRVALLKPGSGFSASVLEKYTSLVEHALELMMYEQSPDKQQLKIESKLRQLNLRFIQYFTKVAQQPIYLAYLPASAATPRTKPAQNPTEIIAIDGVCATVNATAVHGLVRRNEKVLKRLEGDEKIDPMHSVVSVEGGRFLYCLGGTRRETGGVNSAEAFRLDTLSGALRRNGQIASMKTVRGDFAAINVGNYIYVFGGYDSRRSPLKTCERYSIRDNQWEKLSSVIPCEGSGLAGMTATRSGNKVYLIGGFGQMEANEDIFEFNLDTGKFTGKAVARLWFPRGWHVTYLDSTGNLAWIIGGVDGPHAGRVVGHIECLDLTKLKCRPVSKLVCQGPFERPLKLNLIPDDTSDTEQFYVSSVEKYDSVRFSIKSRADNPQIRTIGCEYVSEYDERSPVIYSYRMDT